MILAALLAAGLQGACPAEPPPRPLRPSANASYLAPDGAVRIVGYNDMAGMIVGWDKLFERRHPGVRFAPDLPSTRSAPPALIAGRSALAPMGAEMTPEDIAFLGAPPLVIQVAHDSLDPKALSGPLGVMVAAGNPLRALSLDQIARLYAANGGVRTWGDLGLTGKWATAPIHRLGLKPQTAIALFMQARLFPVRDYTQDLTGFGHSTEVAQAVAKDPLAIGFASLNVPLAGVRVAAISPGPGAPAVAPTRANLQSGRYPLDRQLLIYARAPPDPLVRAYLELALSCEGQALVAADPLGYIPLTPAQAAAERAKLEAADQPPR